MLIDVHCEDIRGNVYTLREPLSVLGVCVPVGFESDGASVPRFFWRIVFPPGDTRAMRAAFAHDYIYRRHPRGWTKAAADALFLSLLLLDGIPYFNAHLAYYGVKFFGWPSWLSGEKKRGLRPTKKKKGKTMKTKILSMLLGTVVAVLCGCTSTKATITEYDADGKVSKVTETSQSVISEVTASTKDKTVVMWESGWAAYLSVSTATLEDPTPTFRAFAGKSDKGAISAIPSQQNWDGIAAAINATKYASSTVYDRTHNDFSQEISGNW